MQKPMSRFSVLVIVLIWGLSALPAAQAQTETVLYTFCSQPGCTDGYYPYGVLLMDKMGNFYSTTTAGGTIGYGTVYKLSSSGSQTVLYSFNPNIGDGYDPVCGVVMDKKGNVYGTAFNGGANGYGTVFKITPSGTETILHSFNNSDGAFPEATLLMDKKGNLYGETQTGGANGGGTVFEVTAGGTYTVLHNFTSSDGALPLGGLIMDKKGNLYGTTYKGGANGYGTIFEISASGSETVLYSFNPGNGTDGNYPFAPLVMDKNGNLYGTTQVGGVGGYGTVFEFSAGGTETVLYSFTGGNDGKYPTGALVMDKKGNLYGTTGQGGANTYGVVFKVSAGTETVLHSFNPNNGTDGGLPVGGLMKDKKGSLYGTASVGGAKGGGIVFKVIP